MQGKRLFSQGTNRLSKPATALRIAVCWLLTICLAACTTPDETWNRVREAGILRVGMDASFPPFEFVAADGALAGFDVDLARELGRRLGLEVQFVANLPYDGLHDALTVGHVDVVISAVVINPAREADFSYSMPYFDAGWVLVTPGDELHGRHGDEALDEFLGGRTLAVEFGTPGDMEARKWAQELANLHVVPHQTATEALAAVGNDDADVALVDHVSALEAIGNRDGLAILGEPVVGEPYAVVVDQQSPRLLQAINDALAAMKADETMDALVAEWLGG